MTAAPEPYADATLAGPFSHRWVAGRALISNLAGSWDFLAPDELEAVDRGTLASDGATYRRLAEKGLIRGTLDVAAAGRQLARRWGFLKAGPSRHVLCITGAAGEAMPPEIALRCLDMAFMSTAAELEITFRGAEIDPLASWPTLDAALGYAQDKNRLARKQLRLVVRSGLLDLDPARAERLSTTGVEPLAILGAEALDEGLAERLAMLSHARGEAAWDAVVPCTRHTLDAPERLVERLSDLGCRAFTVEPALRLDALAGWAGQAPDLCYTPQAYLAFYTRLLDRLALLHAAGGRLTETNAQELCQKVLGAEPPRNPRVRSPAADGIGELAYDHLGRVFASDAGREIGQTGDDLFWLGEVGTLGYHDLLTHPTLRSLVLASTLEGQAGCESCVYRPFCGHSPAWNYGQQGSLRGRMADNWMSLVHKGTFDWIFGCLARGEHEPCLRAWAGAGA